MKRKIGLILSIRNKSKRFPGKVLKKIFGKSTTEHLIQRLKMTSNFHKIIIGTSDDPRDKLFEEISVNNNIDCFFGDKEDKLLRYKQICDKFGLYGVVIVDGDDILCFPEIMDETAKILNNSDSDVVFWKNLPLGAASSGLTAKALSKVLEIKLENDTEVWGGYFTKSNLFKIYYGTSQIQIYNHPKIRMTMDYEEDFYFLCEIFKRIYNEKNNFSSIDLMKLLVEKEPELNDLTKKAQIKYEQNIAQAATVKFKN